MLSHVHETEVTTDLQAEGSLDAGALFTTPSIIVSAQAGFCCSSAPEQLLLPCYLHPALLEA